MTNNTHLPSFRDVVPSSWQEINQILFDDIYRPEINRFRSRRVFRGVSSLKFGLDPGIARHGGHYLKNDLEKHMIRNFSKYGEYQLRGEESIWRKLTKAQHHGLPTRLLDWTYSPYVALHFMTSDISRMDEDGCVWCVDTIKAHEYLPDLLRECREQNNFFLFTAESLDSVCEDLDQFDALGDSFVVFFEPPSIDDRIINQSALFSIMPKKLTDLRPWLQQRPDTYIRIIVKSDLKREVRDKVDQANFTERVLFPGLDGLCKYLARYYGP